MTSGGARRGAAVLAGAMVVALVTGELAARRAGCARGARVLADAEMEYRLAPGRWEGRAGQRIVVNDLSMRSGPISARRDGDGLRVLVIGDSVVFGAELDQSDLATEQLRPLLAATTGRPVEVGNAAAPSWGPPNELAWLRRYGTLGADVVVVVVSSHDADDVPAFDADPWLEPGYGPSPKSALLEWALVRLAAWRRSGRGPAVAPEASEARRACLASTTALLELALGAHAGVVMALHRERNELGGPLPGQLDELGSRGRATGVSVLDLGDVYEGAIKRGQAPYLDRIHLSAEGQALLAQTLAPAILAAAAVSGIR